jgi:hypothetical protein
MTILNAVEENVSGLTNLKKKKCSEEDTYVFNKWKNR